jgi:hypothetical protein
VRRAWRISTGSAPRLAPAAGPAAGACADRAARSAGDRQRCGFPEGCQRPACYRRGGVGPPASAGGGASAHGGWAGWLGEDESQHLRPRCREHREEAEPQGGGAARGGAGAARRKRCRFPRCERAASHQGEGLLAQGDEALAAAQGGARGGGSAVRMRRVERACARPGEGPIEWCSPLNPLPFIRLCPCSGQSPPLGAGL